MATRHGMTEDNKELWNCYYNQTKTKQTNTDMPSSLIIGIE